jgi:hypothetical protein
MTSKEILLKQVEEIHKEFLTLQNRAQYDDISDIPETETIRFNTRARALIQRICLTDSAYSKQTEEIIKKGGYPGYQAYHLFGVIDSLKADISADYLQTHLLDEGYKDAAAVIAGSSLEAHLRQLAIKFGVALDLIVNGKSKIKKADRLNSDLLANNVYTKLDLKNVTAWLDLRNKAAHGHYNDYNNDQVDLMISGIRNFISRIPA